MSSTLVQAQEFHNPVREPVTFGTTGEALKYVVLGDSTAAGQGGMYERGIAVSTARELSKTRRVTMLNLATSGAKTRDVLREQAPLAGRADVVLISVGANDVTHLTCVRSVRRDILQIIERLRIANPRVAIVITGSPDMGAPPRVPRLLRPIAAWRTRQLNRMFVSAACSSGVVFAPIAANTGALFRQNPELFSADRFHPNDQGYATWLPTLYAAINEAFDVRGRHP